VIVELVTKVVVVVVVVSVVTPVKNVLTKNNKDPRFYWGFFYVTNWPGAELAGEIMFGFTIQDNPKAKQYRTSPGSGIHLQKII
jgi:hypothetical protein